MWTVEVFEADDGTMPFQRFANSLSDFKFAALDMAIKHVLAGRGLDLATSEWLRQVDKGLHEFRVRHGGIVNYLYSSRGGIHRCHIHTTKWSHLAEHNSVQMQ